MSTFDTGIMPPQTASAMVDAYNKACTLIDEGYQALYAASALLRSTFGDSVDSVFASGRVYPGVHRREEVTEEIKTKILRGAWGRILELLEVHKFKSSAALAKQYAAVYEGAVPPFTFDAILDLLLSLTQNLEEMHRQTILEAFEILRPHAATHKTNPPFEIGRKVILTERIEPFMRRHRLKPLAEDDMMTVDKAFHILDGRPIPNGYKTPLVDAINTQSRGRTEYVAFKSYQNGNLHLEFLRPDLVAKMNTIAGGNALRSGEPVQPQMF